MKEEKVSINGCVLHKTLIYKSKFNTFFFNNFIKDDDDNNDGLFLIIMLDALTNLSSVTLRKQGISVENIDGEVIRYDVNILVHPKLISFVRNNLSDKYYENLFTKIVPDYFIVEDTMIPEDLIYITENNNCVNIKIER